MLRHIETIDQLHVAGFLMLAEKTLHIECGVSGPLINQSTLQ